jgi:NodT family efflux transporter outer membrane factor (OMF) lipoprotein
MRKTFSIPVLAAVLAAACVAAISMTGCAVGPNYKRPDAPTPTAWKAEGPWRPGDPRDQILKGEWWKVFGEADLDALEAQSMAANQSLKASVARLDQARALARLSTAGLFPQAGVGTSAQDGRESGNRPFTGLAQPTPITQSTYTLPFNVTWETDLFGRVRRTIESAQATYQASGADMENVRLTIASELAADYFTLREIDTEISVLSSTVESFERGLRLVEDRAKGGVASGLDVAQERTLLDATRAQAILLQQQRVQFEDALGTLTGQPASNFKLAPRPMPSTLPVIPVGVPTDLLERRPDIAEAERQMASANAQIGVAKSAYYPDLSLSAGAGFESFSIAKLATVTSSFWSVGAAVAETVLSGGARRAQVQYAQAGYDLTVANYRGSVLTAFQEVEDNLAGLKVLDNAAKAQAAAVADARKALEIATNRYKGGLVNYLDVVTAQQILLSNERLASQIEGQRLTTSVLLVKALGGGWDASSIAALHVNYPAKQALAP